MEQYMSGKVYDQLINDRDFLTLKENIEECDNNFFNIVGTKHLEHWHSAFYGWFLSPKTSHGLGDTPLRLFIELYNSKTTTNTVSIDDLSLNSFDFEFEKQTDNRKFIDLIGENDKAIIVIENKVKASEHDNENGAQTIDYYNYAKEKRNTRKAICVFLTNQRNQKPGCEEFVRITYQEFYDKILSRIDIKDCKDKTAALIIEEYRKNLNTIGVQIFKNDIEIIWNNYENELIAIHNAVDNYLSSRNKNENLTEYKLYNDYKKVLDNIFDCKMYIPSNKGIISPDSLVENGYFFDGMNIVKEYSPRGCERKFHIYGQIVVKDKETKIGIFRRIDDKGDEKEIEKEKNGDYKFFDNTSSAMSYMKCKICEENGLPTPSPTDNGRGWTVYPKVDGYIIKCKYEDIEELYKKNKNLSIENLDELKIKYKVIGDMNYNRLIFGKKCEV